MKEKFIMIHKDTQEYIGCDLSRMDNGHNHPWFLTKDVNEATHDPGCINGHDFTMTMLQCLPKGTYTAATINV